MMVLGNLTKTTLWLALFLTTSVTQAQPSAAQSETARSLVSEGRQLRAKGDLVGALRQFSAADAIMDVPPTGLEVAETQVALGQLVEARETLDRMLAIAEHAGDPESFVTARARARGLARELAKRIGSISLKICSVNQPAKMAASIDGHALPRSMLSLPFRVNPGMHQIMVRLDERDFWQEVEVGEGRAIEVPLECAGETEAHPAPRRTVVAQGAGKRRGHESELGERADSGVPLLTYVGGGVGVVGIAVGSATGLFAISRKKLAMQSCVNGACPPSTWSALEKARDMATISTVAFAVAGAGVTVALGALVFMKPSTTEHAWLLEPQIGKEGGRLNVTGRF